MASASPAPHPTRPAGWVDLRKAGEYPIVLGESLRVPDSGHQLLNLRYNWQPKSGLSGRQSTLKPIKDGYRLTSGDADHEPSIVYSGHARPAAADASEASSSLALVFDKKESVFKLEVIAKSIDLNLESTSSKTGVANRYPKLPRSPAKPTRKHENGNDYSPVDDNSPDPTNPFDFRNFLVEAKENTEKASQVGGSRTPLPGNRTPVSGFASPVPGANQFKASTPQWTPQSKPTTSSPAPKKRKTDENPKQQRLASPARQKPVQKTQKKRKAVEEITRPLSKEKISDSDDELSDTIVVASVSRPLQAPPKGHSRNISGGFGRSPHIVVNDGDLEIDMGSPPQEARGRPRGRIDPGAFRSNTGTPVMGMSSNRRASMEDVRMKDPEEDNSEDGDVEELELGSPRTSRMSMHGSRSASTIEPPAVPVREHAPTPPNQASDDDDDDDLLAAEFEAALEEEQKGTESVDRAPGYGLGITGAAQRVDDEDESEVSEEE